jgi:HAMP domain-containing protein
MTPTLLATAGAFALTALFQLGGVLVWGAMLTNRVRTLEREIAPLRSLAVQVARMDARLEVLVEQFKELNASVRWMRGPARTANPGETGE